MIVVAIIGILAAIAVPQFTQYRVKTQNKVAQSDLRNLATEIVAFASDFKEYPNWKQILCLYKKKKYILVNVIVIPFFYKDFYIPCEGLKRTYAK